MGWQNAPLRELTSDYSAQLFRYVEYGKPAGPLLTAVLANDLRAGIQYAASYPQLLMLIDFVDRWVPGGAWGSASTVEGWVQKGGLHGRGGSVHQLSPLRP